MGTDLKREPGWEARLTQHVIEFMDRRFRWSHADCLAWSCGAVEALTGVDLMVGLRGYRSEAEGIRFGRKLGYDGLEDLFRKNLEPAPIAMLVDGDIVALEVDGRISMGVLAPPDVLAMMPTGLGTVPISYAVRGYRVP